MSGPLIPEAVLLAFFRSRGRFPRFESAVEQRVIDALGEQLDAPAPAGDGELLTARTAERFRAEIRACFGFREATVAVADALIVVGCAFTWHMHSLNRDLPPKSSQQPAFKPTDVHGIQNRLGVVAESTGRTLLLGAGG